MRRKTLTSCLSSSLLPSRSRNLVSFSMDFSRWTSFPLLSKSQVDMGLALVLLMSAFSSRAARYKNYFNNFTQFSYYK